MTGDTDVMGGMTCRHIEVPSAVVEIFNQVRQGLHCSGRQRVSTKPFSHKTGADGNSVKSNTPLSKTGMMKE